MNLIRMAAIFATNAHEGQKRKYTNEPYIVHPITVAIAISQLNMASEVIAAAVLHDVIEDTDATYEDISREFGREVADLVMEVTDVSKSGDGNRKIRKEIDRQHLANASPEGQTIKLADLIDNTSSIVDGDPGFAKVYMAEKKLLLEVLKDGHPLLYNKANNLVNQYYRRK